MNKHTQLIDNYLTGQLGAEEKKEFERRLENDAELKAEFELQKQVLQGVQRSALKAQLRKGLKKAALKAKAGKWLSGILITALAVTIVLAVKSKMAQSTAGNIRYELNEENKKQWQDADRLLKPQLFSINGRRDTVIETEGGIVLSIPAHAFLNRTGDAAEENIELELKEALTPLDIMKAGLSTTSNGSLLETGGMFYINARQKGKNLDIAQNKGIYVNVPDKNPGKHMQLFEGQRLENGQINWINPMPFENKLATVDILSLNFYPPHFLDSLKSFGINIKNKKLTDSIYYSFVCDTKPQAQQAEPARADSTDAYTGPESNPRPLLTATSSSTLSKGEWLFKQNCAVCHSAGTQKLTGPGMAGLENRVPKGDWLKRYILNNEKMIKSGDVYANKLYHENGKAAMTVFEGQLSDADVKAIIGYITNGAMAQQVNNTGSNGCEIDPSRIRAIWNKKFNNTLLATKAFEERLQEIFKTCNASVLELYVKNLDKKMYVLDSMAAEMLGESAAGLKFREFSRQRNGEVSISQSHLQKLQHYMEEKQTIYHEAALGALRRLYEKEGKEDAKALEEWRTHQAKENSRLATLYNEELELNMDEAYRQLGKPRPKVVPAANYLGTTVLSTGWKNVDVYVRASTAKRSTLDYTDKESGKKAVIRYEPFTVTVTDLKKYDRVFAYLIPDKLSSFQRMPASGTSFKEKLDELITYDAAIIGFKGEDIYLQALEKIKPGTVSVSLKKISPKELERYSALAGGASASITDELDYQLFEQKNELRKAKTVKCDALKGRLWPVVFPCYIYYEQ